MLAVALAVAGSGAEDATTIAIGFSLARNLIGWTEYGGEDALEVQGVRHRLDDHRGDRDHGQADGQLDDHGDVLAAAVGIALSGENATSVAGGGLWTDNKIATQVYAYIQSATSVTTTSGGLTVTASDTSHITANAAAGAVSASLAGEDAIAAAIGLSLAHNTIENDVQAYLKSVASVDTHGGAVMVTATDDETVSVTSLAVAVSVAVGGENGYALSGGGSESTNVVNSNAHAYVESSTVGTTATPVGDVTIHASSASSITALVLGVAGAFSFGGETGAAVAIGVAVARNFIGFTQTPPASPTYTMSTSRPTSLIAGNTVAIDIGARKGDVYTYIGPTLAGTVDLEHQDYGDTTKWTDLGTGDHGADYVNAERPASLATARRSRSPTARTQVTRSSTSARRSPASSTSRRWTTATRRSGATPT